ncbi:phage tail protein, partial [Pseudomonas aeruginosa]
MAEVTNFEHNGVSVEATESPEAMGGLGDNVVGLVGTAPNKAIGVPLNAPFRINSRTLAAMLDPTGAQAGSLFMVVDQILKVVTVPIYVVVV